MNKKKRKEKKEKETYKMMETTQTHF